MTRNQIMASILSSGGTWWSSKTMQNMKVNGKFIISDFSIGLINKTYAKEKAARSGPMDPCMRDGGETTKPMDVEG